MAEELLNVSDKAILILNIHNVHDLSIISSPIAAAATGTRTRLLIIIYCTFFDDAAGSDSWDAVQKLLTHAYVQATAVSQKHNRILMCVDVLLRGFSSSATDEPVIDDWNTFFYSGLLEKIPIPKAWQSLPVVHLPGVPDSIMPFSDGTKNSTIYPVVVIGGTFDHLHSGHKILLSMAAWITGKKIIVGVTDDLLLVKKAHKDLLEGLSTRCDAVRNFLQLFKPGLVYEIVAITDVYGPTGWDPNIQALVVSKETLSGATSVATLRSEKGLPPLKTFVIDVISAVSTDLGTDDSEALKNAKMSSTYIRQWIYEQQIGTTGSDMARSGKV